MVLEKTLESPLTARTTNESVLKEINLELFIGRTDAEAETPILWPSGGKSGLIGNNFNPGRDCGQKEKGVAEDEMIRQLHQLNGPELSKLGDSEGLGSLACSHPWGGKELDMT